MRKPHSKAKTGCLQCRQRRIKCTEEKPKCSQCLRHSLLCAYSQSSTSAARSSVVATRSQRQISSPANDSTPQVLSINAPTSALSINLQDLELLHFYSTQTYRSFASNGAPLWQEQVPQLAFSSPYLMHGLLATTALHLAQAQPHRASIFLPAAAAHEALALPYYRDAATNLNPQNCHTIFIFAAFVVAYASALRVQSPKEMEIPPTWMLLLRSSLVLLSSVWPWLSTELPTIHNRPVPPSDCEHNPDDAKLSSLRHLVETHYPSDPDADGDREAYHRTISTLRWSSSLMAAPGTTLCLQAATYVWPRFVSDRYLDLLSASKPKALVLLAYYCVQLNRAEFSWFFRGQARAMLEAIQARLPPEMAEWIEWPVQEVLFGEPHRACGASLCGHGDGPEGHGESQCTDFLLFYDPSWEAERLEWSLPAQDDSLLYCWT